MDCNLLVLIVSPPFYEILLKKQCLFVLKQTMNLAFTDADTFTIQTHTVHKCKLP